MLIESLRPRARAALAALAAVLLTACSGGGGGGGGATPPVTPDTLLVYGTAATGAALAGTVSIEDSLGHVTSLPVTAGSGAFSAAVDGMTAPFMLKVASSDGSTVLYSAVDKPGRANITPLTSLALLRIAAARGLHGPADLYAAPAAFAAWDSAANLASASAAMLGRLMPAFVAQLPGAVTAPQTLPTFDPFGTAWTVGAGVDQLLDAFPVTFTTDGTGAITALQTDHASGLALDVARSDTAAANTLQLAITGAGSGSLVGGSAMQMGALATFAGNVQQPVAATWSVTGQAGASIDANGKLSASAVDTAGSAHVSASWFDGTTAFVATIDITVLPAMRPTSLDITGAAPDAAVAAGASLALGATVHWSDGSTTTPAVTWSWTGDATAVTRLGSDGLLRAGRPAADSPIHVVATFSQGGVAVSSDLALTVSRFVRRVQSVSLAGLVEGQVLTAGDHADLVLTARWNDGSESTLAPVWNSGPVTSGVNHILTSVSSAGRLTTSSYFVPTSADAGARAPEADLLTASYDNGDGTSGQLAVNYAVKPMVNVPVGLEIHGVTALPERSTSIFQVLVDYADGSSQVSDATLNTQDPTVLLPTQTAGAFAGGTYPDTYTQPATPLSTTLTATRSFTYQDTTGQTVTTVLTASQHVDLQWVPPTIIAVDTPVDHLVPGQATPIAVNATMSKFDFYGPTVTANATLTTDGSLVSVSGTTLTAQAPASPDGSWPLLTIVATNPYTQETFSSQKRLTIDLAGAVPKHLLPHDYSPLDTDVQFRGISSDGHVDDYTVDRTGDSFGLAYDSPVQPRRLRLLSGVTAFEQSRTIALLYNGESQETQYIAAVEQGHVVVVRHDDLYASSSLATPIVVPGIANATAVAIVTRIKKPDPQSPAVRLYVLDQSGIVRQYSLPYFTNAPLAADDLVLERQLPGTWSQISGGADFVLLRATDNSAWSEGDVDSFALGDPARQSHWDAPFAIQQGFYCEPDCRQYSALGPVTQVHAGFERTWVSLAGLGIAQWGTLGPATVEWFGYDIPQPATTPPVIAQLVSYAWLDPAGTVHYDSYTFALGDKPGPNDLSLPHTTQVLPAKWLPPIAEIVDGRRNPVAAWPYTFEEYLSPVMPVVRATDDSLYYLDGRRILDARTQQPLMLP